MKCTEWLLTSDIHFIGQQLLLLGTLFHYNFFVPVMTLYYTIFYQINCNFTIIYHISYNRKSKQNTFKNMFKT